MEMVNLPSLYLTITCSPTFIRKESTLKPFSFMNFQKEIERLHGRKFKIFMNLVSTCLLLSGSFGLMSDNNLNSNHE